MIARFSPTRSASRGARKTLETATHTPQPKKISPISTAPQRRTNGDQARTVKNAAV